MHLLLILHSIRPIPVRYCAYKIKNTSMYKYLNLYSLDQPFRHVNVHVYVHFRQILKTINAFIIYIAFNSTQSGSVMCVQNPEYVHVQPSQPVFAWSSLQTCQRACVRSFWANTNNNLCIYYTYCILFVPVRFGNVLTKFRIRPGTRIHACIRLTICSYI